MKKSKIIVLVLVGLITAGTIYLLTHSHEAGHEEKSEKEHAHEGDEHGHEESGESAEITEAASKNAGLVIEAVQPATIKQTTALSGKITLNQNKTALIKARFPGIIRSIKKAQGDTVAADEILATIESNESLQVYPVKSPLTGTVLAKNGNIGDVTGDEAIFTVADINELWVELHVFAQDAGKVKVGQQVIVSSSECDDVQEATITSVLPITESSSQTLLARATIKNLDSHWLPGMSVRGDAVIATSEAPLAVKTSAIQRMEGKQVVFVQEGDDYHARTVELGASDDKWTEIKSGVEAGEKYVSDGSFTVKAEIGKSEAEHSH